MLKPYPSWLAFATLLLVFASCKTYMPALRTFTPAQQQQIKQAARQLPRADTSSYVMVLTSKGPIVLKLYNSTPLHSTNFLQKAAAGFYDSLLFHRVIDSFMVQGGDPNSKQAEAGQALGGGSAAGGRIPAEFRVQQNIIHERGSLAAARDQNPEKASSNCQFYIVQRKAWRPAELDSNAARRGYTLNDYQRQVYTTVGGTPHLDGNYTVYGEVVSGMDVVDAIALSPRDSLNRPRTDVRMRMVVLHRGSLHKQ